tara:strand:- start:120 stop:443 length:324 start_codon:yes stop_codon:yes gene_type:complete
VKPKYISVHLFIKFNFVNSILFPEKNEKFDIFFGFSNKNRPLIKSSLLDKTLGVVSLFINKDRTVNIKIRMMMIFFFIVIEKQSRSDQQEVLKILKICNKLKIEMFA